jgi:hypothetical protein
MKYLAEVPDEDIDKITHLNAMRHFSYDPFAFRPREQCTVGALRAEAGDVDVRLMARSSVGQGPPKRTVAADLSRLGRSSRTTGDS